MKLIYDKSNKKQMSFIEDNDSRKILFLAGRGSGKTYGGAIKALGKLTVPDSVGMIICPTYKQLLVAQTLLWELMYKVEADDDERNYIRQLQDDTSQPLLVKNYNKAEKDLHTIFGSKVHFRSGQNPDALRGYNLSWYWVDEPALIKRDVILNLDMTLRRELENVSLQSWLTTTPKGFNWLYNDLDEYKVYRATTYDNEHNLPTSFMNSLPKDGVWRAQEVMGEFVEMEGLVFTEQDYRIWDVNDIKEIHLIAHGIDFGYASPASVISVAELTSATLGKITYVYREVYSKQMTTKDLYNSVHGVHNPIEVPESKSKGYFADPSLPDNIEELRRLGLRISRANNDILFGIDKIKRANLVISPNCENLITELKQYTWANNGKPQKGFDHAIDAMRYAIVAVTDRRVATTANFSWFQTDDALYERLNV